MEAKWLSVQSFLQNQRLISAINTLCTSLVLRLEGEEDDEDPEILRESRETVQSFLNNLNKDILDYERSMHKALPGVDPRQYELVKRFVAAKRKRAFSSKAFRETPGKIAPLLDSKNPDHMETLLKSLSELRVLLEEHNQADVQNLVPEI